MLKSISIGIVLVVLAVASANAQQREATLQRLPVPGTNFDIIIVTPKAGGAVIDQRGLPDPLIVNIAGGELAVAVDGEVEKMFKDGFLLAPNCTFHVNHKGGDASPVGVYVVPKSQKSASQMR
jgi:hypothetical protein